MAKPYNARRSLAILSLSMPQNNQKPLLQSHGMPCPRCQQHQGYMQQEGYHKDFHCPVCLYQCPAKHYRTRQRQMTATLTTEDGEQIKISDQDTSEQLANKLNGKEFKQAHFTEI